MSPIHYACANGYGNFRGYGDAALSKRDQRRIEALQADIQRLNSELQVLAGKGKGDNWRARWIKNRIESKINTLQKLRAGGKEGMAAGLLSFGEQLLPGQPTVGPPADPYAQPAQGMPGWVIPAAGALVVVVGGAWALSR